MAGLKNRELKKIDLALTDLLSGNIYRPVDVSGGGLFRSCKLKLEEVRCKLVKLGDEKAEYLNANKSAVASVIHDLKTPLAVISGYVECLQDGMDDKDYAKLIGEKTRQLNDMVMGMLSLSKEEILKVNEQIRPVNTQDYFRGVCERLAGLVKKKKDTLKISKIPSAKVRLSPIQFERVIQNILSNAIKYSEEGAKIKIKFSKTENRFNIRIKDNGKGIPKEDLPHIFEQFYKGDKARSDQSSNGIGLYTAKEIVGAHGGTIKVRSAVNKGTTFTISLPISRVNKEKTPSERFDAIPLAGKAILVTLFGPFVGISYRITKFVETHNKNSIIGAVLSYGLMPFIWITDIISVLVYGKITFLAD